MPRPRFRTEEEVAWLVDNVPVMTTDDARRAFEDRFGWLPPIRGWQVWNAKRGLHPMRRRPCARTACERSVRWSNEPEMDAWMLEHDHGQSRSDIIDEFEDAFGFRLTGDQVSAHRQRHGRQVKQQPQGGRQWDVPVGAERVKKGYVWVKTAPYPTKRGTHDNWMQKHLVVYEAENGAVPDGHVVVFADRDRRNFDPGNLVAVPKTLMGALNNLGGWHDRESLELAIGIAKLESGIHDAEAREQRVCSVCGKAFNPRRFSGGTSKSRACPECVASGHRSSPRRSGKGGEKVCEVCGARYVADRSDQRRCRACIAEKPKHGIDQHRKLKERHR